MTVSIRQDGGDSRIMLFIIICDASQSMFGSKIDALNHAMHELAIRILEFAKKNPHLKILIQVIKVSGAESELVFPQPVSAEDFQWTPLTTYGGTPLGDGINKTRHELQILRKDKSYLQPIVAMISDGQPTDDWEVSNGRFQACPIAGQSQKFAVAIGDADRAMLSKFCVGSEIGVLEASNAAQLVDHIVDNSLALAEGAATGRSIPGGVTGGPYSRQSIDLGDLPAGSINESFIDDGDFENNLY